jgi:uncharacterized protein YcfJ
MKDDPKQPGQEPDHSLARRIGTLAGTILGGAAGTVAGPGTAVGAMVGGAAGGATGEDIAQALNGEDEDRYWREQHRHEPYYVEGSSYDTRYAPIYRLGWESRVKYHGRVYDDTAPYIRAEFDALPGKDMGWDEAEPAVRAAWDRADERVRGFNGN